MYFQRFYDSPLAQASYLIGCQATGEAVVIDANRDIAQYVEAAEAQKLGITHVTETHIHADYVSGSRELAHAAAHVPGTLNIPLGRSFSTWAGWLLPYDRDIHLIVDDESRALDEAVRDLAMIGLDRIAGVFGHDAVGVWRQAAAAGHIAQADAAELHDTLLPRGVAVIDVRNQSEWDAGHLAGAHHVQLGTLEARLDEVPRDGVVVVHCQGGTRSAIAASLLAARGYENVINLQGGYREWTNAGYPVTRDHAPR